MIYYSIVPYESMMNNAENDYTSYNSIIMNYKGYKIEAYRYNNGITKINRIISTSPQDYLNSSIAPGTIINDL